MAKPKLSIEITPDLLFEACALVYSRWSKEYEILRAVRLEKNDGSKDWPLFHAARLKAATESEALWNTRRLEAGTLSSLALASS